MATYHTYHLEDFEFVSTSGSSGSSESIKHFLLERLGLHLQTAKTEISQTLSMFNYCAKQSYTLYSHWEECQDKCAHIAKQYIQQEMQSTLYILQCLVDSVLTISSMPVKVVFGVSEPTRLTGSWKNDMTYISLLRYGTIDRSDRQPGRLIVGLGPSGSGKSYWTQTIIKMFTQADRTFPDTFITIDGGIYRLTSQIYTLLRDVAQAHCLSGFSNLVRASKLNPLHSSLFEAGKIKKVIRTFLKRESMDIPICLYVPETLGGCLRRNCISEIKPYIEITRDTKWIALLIWQHKLGSDCNYSSPYKCVGCTESGKQREQVEGKPYSNQSWKNAMRAGKFLVGKAPGGSYEIHNSGSSRKSILFSRPSNPPLINGFLEHYADLFNFVYTE